MTRSESDTPTRFLNYDNLKLTSWPNLNYSGNGRLRVVFFFWYLGKINKYCQVDLTQVFNFISYQASLTLNDSAYLFPTLLRIVTYLITIIARWSFEKRRNLKIEKKKT